MELKQITEKTYYIPGQTNLGLFVQDNQAILIDSGNSESAGRKIYRLLESKRWKLKEIINTHSHADHIGGNAYLQKKTGCGILATYRESVWINHPELEPLFLWGASPFKVLKSKFLQAQPSEVTQIIPAKGLITDTLLKAFPLRGHFLEMIGVKTPDGVFFIADSLFSPDIITKYGVTVKTDIEKSLKTHDFLEKFPARFYVPSHGPITHDLTDLIRANRKQIENINQKIVSYCKIPVSREEILQLILKDYQIQLSSIQYILTHMTVSAHISYLCDKQIIRSVFEDGKMLWVNKDTY